MRVYRVRHIRLAHRTPFNGTIGKTTHGYKSYRAVPEVRRLGVSP
jgi:hypothetical protein